MPLGLRRAARLTFAAIFGEAAAQRLAESIRRSPPAPASPAETDPKAAFRNDIAHAIGEPVLGPIEARDEFVMSEDDPSLLSVSGSVTWAPAAFRGSPYSGLCIPAESSMSTPPLRMANDSTLVFELAMGAVEISFQAPGVMREIVHIGVPCEVTVDLSALDGFDGQIVIRAFSDAVVLKWIVARSDRVGLLHGRSNYTRRLATEKRFFTDVYDHEIYRSRGVSSEERSFDVPHGGFRPDVADLPDADAVRAMPEADLVAGDNAQTYGLRLLDVLIGREAPDFARRLVDLGAREPVRVLSLCSGIAGIERQIIAAAGIPAEITLFDINPSLMGRAAATLSPYARVFGVLGDVNDIDPEKFDQPYDVVMCVSALHHVVELERALSAASALLGPGGEFWVVGEQIGRNGNRLWPEVRDAANRAFGRLPAELRRHSIDGVVDDALREMDYSSTTFEGIRSEEIEPLLSRYFEPLQVHRRNCFLWRALEPSYFANYDLDREAHRRAIHGLVAAEYAIWRTEGRPTEMWAAYRGRSAPA